MPCRGILLDSLWEGKELEHESNTAASGKAAQGARLSHKSQGAEGTPHSPEAWGLVAAPEGGAAAERGSYSSGALPEESGRSVCPASPLSGRCLRSGFYCPEVTRPAVL